MLAGFGQPYMRGPSPPSARLKLSFLATVSTLQARRLKLEASVEIEKRDPSLRSKSAQVFQSDEAQVCASNHFFFLLEDTTHTNTHEHVGAVHRVTEGHTWILRVRLVTPGLYSII